MNGENGMALVTQMLAEGSLISFGTFCDMKVFAGTTVDDI